MQVTRAESELETRRNTVSGTRLLARAGDRLGSPVVLAAAVCLLVAIVGVVSTVSSYRALRRGGEHRADASVTRRAAHLRSTLGAAFDSADPVLDALAPVVRATPSTDLPPLLERMRVLGTARYGVSWISASFPDGTFVGIQMHDDGRMEPNVSHVGSPHGTALLYTFGPDGVLVPGGSRPIDYDPRTRSFYRLAVAEGARAWTDPYPFVPTLRTGVTRVEPLYRGQGERRELLAVLTVDFDASELAKLLDRPIVAHERLVVVTDDGSVLASSGVRIPAAASRSRSAPLRIGELHDAPLARAARALVADRSEAVRSIEVAGRAFRVDRRTLLRLGRERLSVLSVVPEAELYREAHREARAGVLTTGGTSLLGILLSLALASNIARLRKKRAEAERAAARAHERVLELGSYELVAPIGTGGMGEVWRARHKLLAHDAALKLIRPDDTSGTHESRNDRFFAEARTLASMRSIHTVAVYDFGVADDGRCFLAMELLDGIDLDELVRRHGPQPAARIAAILAQICDSLAEAHEAGLVHQDIKPANVFLCQIAESLDLVKVLDFGLSRAIGKRHGDGSTVEGTPAFMAPEQAMGETLTAATDLYAVGCVGYWLLTGRFPYDAKSSEEHMRAHVSSPVPTLPHDVAHRTHVGLVQLVTRCLAKKPDHRPASAVALANALRRVESECGDTFTREDRVAFWARRGEERARAHAAEQAPTYAEAGATIRVHR